MFNLVNIIKPSIITIQESKMRMKRKITLPGYQLYEKVRTDKAGGGIITAIINDLDHVLVHDAPDGIEILTVEIDLGVKKIRVINGYAPQETATSLEISKFWQELETQVNLAKSQSREILIQLDANAKLGNHIIHNDPHEMSDNGKVFYDFVSRQDLVVLNSLDKCKGTITRERTALNRKESSVLD